MKQIITIKSSMWFLTLALLFVGCKDDEDLISAEQLIVHQYTKNDGPDQNPLKGWNSGWWNEDDIATVGFQYIGWRDFEPVDDQFNFEAVEKIINRPGTRNKHLVLRLFTDWYGDNLESAAGPSWLYDDLGVERLKGPNGRYLTDYNNQAFIDEVTEAIAALASNFDKDPRLFSFQIGVLGYWGEWHNAGFNGDFKWEEATQNQILNAYQQGFSRVKVMGRYPWREPLMSAGFIGFHNDFFGPSGHSNEFDEAIQESSMYLQGPIGGEAPPDVSDEEFGSMMTTGSGMDMIKKGHYTVMMGKSSDCDTDPKGARCQGYMAINRKMGYNYQIDQAVFAEQPNVGQTLEVEVLVDNIGVAPIYYDWNIQVGLIDADGGVTMLESEELMLTTITPESSFTVNAKLSEESDIAEGDYKLALRIIQPEADASKTTGWKLDARNTYILFSNDLPTIQGEWNEQNALVGGWSILGDVTFSRP